MSTFVQQITIPPAPGVPRKQEFKGKYAIVGNKTGDVHALVQERHTAIQLCRSKNINCHVVALGNGARIHVDEVGEVTLWRS